MQKHFTRCDQEVNCPCPPHAPAITSNSKNCNLITVFANSISLFICSIFSSRVLFTEIESLQEVHLRQAFLAGKNTLII